MSRTSARREITGGSPGWKPGAGPRSMRDERVGGRGCRRPGLPGVAAAAGALAQPAAGRGVAADRRAGQLSGVRDVLLDRRTEVAEVMRSRSTQTNEPARCAVLLPALAPGAAARAHRGGGQRRADAASGSYGYDYAGQRIEPADPAAPVLTCRPRGPVPVPAAVPRWPAGRDRPEPPGCDRPGRHDLAEQPDLAGEAGRAERRPPWSPWPAVADRGSSRAT